MTPDPFELYWRNPYNYHRELLVAGECNIAWDKGVTVKYSIDPVAFSSMKFGHQKWRTMVVSEIDCVEYNSTSNKPVGVYPTYNWQEDDDLDLLDEYIDEPWGDSDLVKDPSLLPIERPIKGQRHVVAIVGLPNVWTYEGRQALAYVANLQKRVPEVTFFMHRLYSYGAIFGNGFRIGSVDPRTMASKGEVMLQNGYRLKLLEPHTRDWAPFLRPFGWKLEDMELASNRCLFNMQTAMYASRHWDKGSRPAAFKPKGFIPDTESPEWQARVAEIKKNRQDREAKLATK